MQIITIEAVKAFHRSKGGQWFDRESAQPSRSKSYKGVVVVEDGTLFVSSEKGYNRTERRCSVRHISNETGEISTIGEYRGYAAPIEAKTAMRELAERWLTADKIAAMLFNLRSSHEQSSNLEVSDEQEEFAVDYEDLREFRQQRRLERNAQLVNKVKQIKGYICEACDFDFVRVYGELGQGYIEAHHLVPISQLKGQKVPLHPERDFAVLCANCHRMIHRYGKVDDIEGFRRLLKRP